MFQNLRTTAGLAAVCLLATVAGCGDVDLNREAPQAAAAVKAACPEATLTGASPGHDGGVKTYEAHLTQGQRELDVTVSADGQVIEVETTVTLSEITEPAGQVIAKEIQDATLLKLERVEHRGIARNGKITMLDKPDVFYEAKYRKGIIMHEVQWSPDGSRR